MEKSVTTRKYKQHLAIMAVIGVVLIGGAYYAGVKHGTSAAAAKRTASGFGGGAGARAGGAGRFASGAGLVTGSVIAKDDTSITIKSRDGSSKIVLYSPSTQVLKSTAGTASDVTVGSNVSAQGTQNTDGSVTATSIQIRPNMPAAPASAAPATTQ